jgi:Zn-dependent protease with chaperone function
MKDARRTECPNCGTALVSLGGGPSWCPQCEWNLGAWDPVVLPPRGWRSLERRGHAAAYRLDRAMFARLSAKRPTSVSWSASGIALAVVSVAVLLADLAAFVVGIALLIEHPSFWLVNLGVLLVLLGLLFRPRFGRLPRERSRLARSEAPSLFTLIEQVAVALDAPSPDYVVLDLGVNASVGRRGVRRRTVLRLGGGLWTTLSPGERVAVLAHELGHTVNGDPNRSLLVAPVLTSFGRLAEWTGAERTLGSILHPDRKREPGLGLLGELALYVVSRVFLVLHIGVTAIGMRDHQRAEYLADGWCAEVAGTDAAVSLMDRLLLGAYIARLTYHNAAHHRPAQWLASIDAYRATRTADLELLRQHDARSTSLWEAHPPPGRRARMLLAWPHYPPRVVLGAETSTRIDAELAPWIDAVHRDILDTRDFHERAARPAG